jgi:DNA helicase II / ATP-dependent DNA helicase PcrA
MSRARSQSDRSESQLPAQVAEEQRTLERVKRALLDRAPRRWTNYVADLVELRDSLGEERLEEDRASILEQMHRLSRLAAQQEKMVHSEVVDPRSPYFGHMRLCDHDTEERKDILVGKRTFIRAGVTVVDWRNAPISKVFYQTSQGDDYELEVDGRELSGVVELRRTVTIQGGELLRVRAPEGAWVLSDGAWVEVSDHQPQLSGGAGTAARPDRTRPVLGVQGGVPGLRPGRRDRFDKHLPEIASLLDAEQFERITSPEAGLLAISGSAGSGKTTVALHRVAYLVFQDSHRFSPDRTQVIVGSRALASYIMQVLPALGVEGVAVTTFESWASKLRRRHFPKLPRRYADDTPFVVTRLKLHSALVPVLAEAVAQYPSLDPVQLFEELFTSRQWLGELFEKHAPGAFNAGELDQVHRWCSRQHFIRVDGEGANEHEKPALDVEDDALLLRLHQLVKGRLRYTGQRPLAYNHLVVDEVQDLSPIELAVLLDTASPRAAVTLAGDTAQRLNEDADFRSWEEVLSILGHEGVELSPLKVSYRSTVEIMRVAREVLGPLAPEESSRAVRHGAPVELFRFGSAGEASTFLVEVCRHLVEAEPNANLAILTRFPQQADELYSVLARAELRGLRRVHDQDFSFAPGIEVTDIRQTKGLEFDYVIVADCDAQTFPVTPSSRHLLHVAITRAAHQCWLVSVGSPTRLLPAGLVTQR